MESSRHRRLLTRAVALAIAASTMTLAFTGCRGEIEVPEFPDSPPSWTMPPLPPTTTAAPTTTTRPTTTTPRPTTSTPRPTTSTRPPLTSIIPIPPTTTRPAPKPTPTTTTQPPPPPPGVPVGKTVVFVGDFDNGFGQWSNIQTQGYNSSGSGFRGNTRLSIANGGPGHETAARFTVQSGDRVANGERAEVRGPDAADVSAGDERWYQWQVMFPADFPNPADGWFILMQWHAGDGPPPLSLEVSSAGELRLHNNRSGKRTVVGQIVKGRWMDLTLHVKFSAGSDAFAEAWVDGKKSANVHRHPNLASSGGSNYLKMGIYRSPQSRTHVVWHDGLRITRP